MNRFIRQFEFVNLRFSRSNVVEMNLWCWCCYSDSRRFLVAKVSVQVNEVESKAQVAPSLSREWRPENRSSRVNRSVNRWTVSSVGLSLKIVWRSLEYRDRDSFMISNAVIKIWAGKRCFSQFEIRSMIYDFGWRPLTHSTTILDPAERAAIWIDQCSRFLTTCKVGSGVRSVCAWQSRVSQRLGCVCKRCSGRNIRGSVRVIDGMSIVTARVRADRESRWYVASRARCHEGEEEELKIN